jgi:hypothetical protein
MNPIFEVLLPRRPISYQGTSKSREEWKNFIYGRAFSVWNQTPISDGRLRFSVVYLCESDPADINNLIKPIQDAMISLVYADDSLVCDVTGHMRLLSDPIDIVGLPSLLADAVITGSEYVYVQITNSNELNQEVSQ